MPINKTDIELRQSQRLDDTRFGGGQMTSHKVISGEINNLYPDISHLDRTYGRVSLRKAYLHVNTKDRSTYYGAHAGMLKNADDPNVSVCFFSDDNWFSTRSSAQSRLESYLVQSTLYPGALWGNHYIGTRLLQMHTHKNTKAPDVGDTIVLVQSEGSVNEKRQFVRVRAVTEELQEFNYGTSNASYTKKVLSVEIGEYLEFDFTGEEMFWEGAGLQYGNAAQKTKIYKTTAADASRYYGVSPLKEPATKNTTLVRVDSILTPLVPSTQSTVNVADATVANNVSPIIQTAKEGTPGETINKPGIKFILANNSQLSAGCAVVPGSLTGSGGYSFIDNGTGGCVASGQVVGSINYDTGTITFNDKISGYTEATVDLSFKSVVSLRVTRPVVANFAPNGKLFLGEGILPGSFTWTGGMNLTDDGIGNILFGTATVGSISYVNGIITFSAAASSFSGTGVASYIPAAQAAEVAQTGAIKIEVGNRVYTHLYNCNPVPKKGTTRVDYLAGGKWYTLQDRGDGALRGDDASIGSGVVNFVTGTLSLTLGALPDVGSLVMIYWAKDAPYYDLSGDVLDVYYKFTTHNVGIARNTFICSWNSDSFAVIDDGSGNLTVADKSSGTWVKTGTIVGKVEYASGKVEFKVAPGQDVPEATGSFWIRYSYGEAYKENFNPIRNSDGTVTFNLSRTPVLPGTFKVEWHTDLEEYDGASGMRRHIDPTHIYFDDTQGRFLHETPNGSTNWVYSTISYSTGAVRIMPDRVGVFPITRYIWKETGLFDENHVPLREFFFHSIDYRPAASLWPTDGIFQCEYRTNDGNNSDDYYETIPMTFVIREGSNLELVPGSLSFMMSPTYIQDRGTGKLYHTISGIDGSGVECGTVNYLTRTITITDNNIAGRTAIIKSASGTIAIDPVQFLVFRAPAAPLVPASFGIRATLDTGVLVSGTSNMGGKISGDGVEGDIDFQTGIAKVAFGKWETDTYSALPPEQQPEWYAGAPTNGGQVWHPYSVKASTVLVNCTVSSYLPLDPKLLGLNPVRLPLDGRVPIFRDGYIVLISHTKEQALPSPVTNGQTYNLDRTDVDDIVLYDSTGKYVTEMENGNVNYTYDTAAGTVTIGATADFSSYTQPLRALHRIEDMVIATDVQITGHIGISQPLAHDYPAGETMVSSIIGIGDVQSGIENEFIQSAWSEIWSDDKIGSSPLASYDFVNFPITILNNGSIQERWLIRFRSNTVFDVVGEHLGVIMEGISIAPGQTTGWVLDGGQYYLDVMNRLTGERYFRMAKDGFSGGWQSGNCIRFNSRGANHPFWFVRTTLQGRPTLNTDNYQFILRGDAA